MEKFPRDQCFETFVDGFYYIWMMSNKLFSLFFYLALCQMLYYINHPTCMKEREKQITQTKLSPLSLFSLIFITTPIDTIRTKAATPQITMMITPLSERRRANGFRDKNRQRMNKNCSRVLHFLHFTITHVQIQAYVVISANFHIFKLRMEKWRAQNKNKNKTKQGDDLLS